jgi:glycosyltransferase involved in cell wall biosynthesis
VGILTCDCFDAWLEEIGVSVDSFCDEMMGTWWFNYMQALESSGLRAVLFCTSQKFAIPRKFIHKPTGSTICVLPASAAYARVQRWRSRVLLSQAAGVGRDFGKRAAAALLGLAASYLSTPLFALAKVLKQEACSCLLVEQYEDPRFDVSVLLGRMIGVSVYGTFAAVQPREKWWHRLYRPLRSFSLRLSSGLAICSEQEITRVFRRYTYPSGKLAQIAYPVDSKVWYPGDRGDARAILGISASAKVAVYHGAIDVRVKGLDVLIEAWAQLVRSRPGIDLRLLLIGTGRDSGRLALHIAALSVPGVQWLTAWVHDRELLRRYLVASDVYVFPSREDAFGIAVLEAMACGLPVVAACAPGMLDIFKGGEASGGLLVPTNDAKAFCAALERVIDDDAFANGLGERARRRVEAVFSMDAIGKQLRRFLFAGG